MISFLQPWALAALPLAAIPLLLHLISRRDPPTVSFPAVRYLLDVTREHERRLKLRNWLLLLLRTLLVLALIVAAAGPASPRHATVSHGPSALALILDNSPSSGVVIDGTARLTDLRAAARAVLDQATPNDALWLLTADGVPQRGTAGELEQAIDSLTASGRRLDLGAALTLGSQVVASDGRPGGVVLVSDLQASAVSPTNDSMPTVVVRVADPPPPNVGIGGLDPGAQPWTPEGGSVTVLLIGDSSRSVPVSVRLANRPARQGLGAPGTSAGFTLPGTQPGWWTVTAEKDPDELRADDERVAVVRIAPIAGVNWSGAGRYVAAAGEVLTRNGRSRTGNDVSVGAIGPHASIVLPPEDPADLGALNRALERRGVGWVFDRLSLAPGVTDSGGLIGRERVAKRYKLRSTRAGGNAATAGRGVIVTVGGEPWLVRSGDVVLLGSRLDPEWTSLPLAASFMPFMDALVNRLARGEVALLTGAPGDAIALPDLVSDVVSGTQRWPVEGGAAFHPPVAGTYYLLSGRDTVGSLSANIDPRESALAPAEESVLHRLWPKARFVGARSAGAQAFAAVGRADLQGPLLWAAFALAVIEVVLASGRRRKT